jgi:hypothetical protein
VLVALLLREAEAEAEADAEDDGSGDAYERALDGAGVCVMAADGVVTISFARSTRIVTVLVRPHSVRPLKESAWSP